MSKIGKASLLICGLFVLASGIVRLVLNQWHDSLYVSLGLALVFFIVAMMKDARTYADFFTMRTTKHGMNMGVLIVLVLGMLVMVNFVAVLQDKKADWTSDGLNSLSDQSLKAAKALKDDVQVVLLLAKEQDADPIRRAVQDLVQMYRNANNKITFVSHSARSNPAIAAKYGYKGEGAFGLFLDAKDKHIKVESSSPQISEEDLTKAMIKFTRESKKSIYFVKGHGERALDSEEQDGLKLYKQELQTLYDVKELSLIETAKIPDDAVAVAVVGPQQQFLESEIQALREYARTGGHLLIAIDPGQQHNLAQLTKTLGVEFNNNYIIDPRESLGGGTGVWAALGIKFSNASAVTRDFPPGQIAAFFMSSSLAKAQDAQTGFKFEELVSSSPEHLLTNEVAEKIKASGRGPFLMGLSVEGKLPEGPADTKTVAMTTPTTGNENPDKENPDKQNPVPKKESKEFTAVVYGDSDFMTNKLFRFSQNRDLAMNSVSYLAKDTDMISIRPRQPKGTVLNMTREKFLAILLGFLIPLPIALFSTGGVIWYRRKTA